MAYEIRPMSVGEILDTGFRLLRNHFGLLMAVAAIAQVPMAVLQQAMERAIVPDPEHAADALVSILVIGGLMLLVFGVLFPLVATAMTMALGDLYVGRPTGAGTALEQSWSILMPVVGTSLLASIFIGLGMLALFVPGIWLIFHYAVVTPVVVIERIFGMTALRRSGELMRGNKGRAFLIGLVLMVLVAVVSGGATWALSAWPLLNGAVGLVVAMATSAFLSAVRVVFYFDVRCRREAFDLEHLAQLVEQRGGATAGAALL